MKTCTKSTLRLPSINAEACSGLTLSGALHTALKGRAWRRRMGQEFWLKSRDSIKKSPNNLNGDIIY